MSRDLVPISGAALRKAMLESDSVHTQVQLVEASGVAQAILSRVLRGEQKRIESDKLGSLANALGLWSPLALRYDPTQYQLLKERVVVLKKMIELARSIANDPDSSEKSKVAAEEIIELVSFISNAALSLKEGAD